MPKQNAFVLLLVLFFSIQLNCFAQTESAIDSLEALLKKNTKDDTLKVVRLYELEMDLFDLKPEQFGQNIGTIASLSQKLNFAKGKVLANLLYSYEYMQKGDLLTSIKFAQYALNTVLKLQDAKLIIQVYGQLAQLNNRSVTNETVGNYQRAIYYIQQEIYWIKKANLLDQLPAAYQTLALTYFSNDEPKKALEPLYESLRLNPAPDYAAFTENLIGRGLMMLKRHEEAQMHYDKSIQMGEKYKIKRLLSIVYTNSASNLYQLKRYNEAEVHVQKSLELAELTSPKKVSTSIKLLARINYGQRKVDEAYNHLLDYIKLSDSLASAENDKTFLELQTKYETERKEQENKLLTLQNAQIKVQNTLYLVSAGLSVLLVLVIGIFYWQSRKKSAALNQLNSVKDRLFSIIAHDLKRPANSFQNLIPVFQFVVKKKQYDRLEDVAIKAQAIASDMTLILDNLFRWGLSQQGKLSINMQEVDIRPIVEDLQNEFDSMAQIKNIRLENLCMNDVRVMADKTLLMLVLRNMLSNALKFTRKGGYVRITVEQTPANTCVIIEDNGIGIPENIQKQLFELNTTKSRKGTDGEQGSGLGLLLSKELIEHTNGGSLKVRSVENQGTVVTVCFDRIHPK